MALVLGIDTGATYADGVVCDLSGNRVLTKTKALTTYDDLAIMDKRGRGSNGSFYFG